MRGGPEVADVFRRYGGIYRDVHAGHLSLDQRKVMGAIEACRSPALGGHVEQCGTRGSRTIPAAIGIARSVRGWLVLNGWPTGGPTCCRHPTSTSSSLYRHRLLRSPSRTKPSSTAYCSRRRPRRSASSPPTQSIGGRGWYRRRSAHMGPSSPTPSSSSLRSPGGAAHPPTAPNGLVAAQASFCP
jgi:hypothetical protein